MKMPKKPPEIDKLFSENASQLSKIFTAVSNIVPQNRYIHWDQLIHLKPPDDLSHEKWWLAIKLQRQSLFKMLPLKDHRGKFSSYLITDPIPEKLHQIDLSAGGRVEMPDQITNPETKDRYHVSSLIEEAITSSQLEGASTTRAVAKDMIRSGRKPRDRNERMIFNNYLAMKKIGEFKTKRLSKELIFEMHRVVTQDTLDDPDAAGRFRRDDELICVADPITGNIFHTPPPASELDERMAVMCAFANGETPNDFIHPVVRSIILHFWLAYDHPLVDGNGRTARTLFYWSMLHHGYWLCEFISISHILLKAPTKYSRAFLFAETDDNDLTYFILYHLNLIDQAVHALHEYIAQKTKHLKQLELELKNLVILNYRQRALLAHALRHPNQQYTIHGHQASHNVVYETARADLIDLQKKLILEARKIGKRWYFTPTDNFEQKLINLG